MRQDGMTNEADRIPRSGSVDDRFEYVAALIVAAFAADGVSSWPPNPVWIPEEQLLRDLTTQQVDDVPVAHANDRTGKAE